MPVARYVEYLTPCVYLDEIITQPFRPDAEAASTAVVVDPTGWDQSPPATARRPPPHLEAVGLSGKSMLQIDRRRRRATAGASGVDTGTLRQRL